MSGALAVPVGPADHMLGPESAPLTLVQYGDYECPHCGQAQHVVHQLRRQFGDRLRVVFRHFPIAEVHPQATAAAEAAEAAAAQHAFWPMHDLLFRHQADLRPAALLALAAALSLDADLVARALAERTHRAIVRAHFSGGIRSGVDRVPAFFVNGFRHRGPSDAATLAAALGWEGRH